MDGKRPKGVTAKDIILTIIGEIGTAGATGTVVEYRGETIASLSMEQRMTICNMSIEAGARAGMIAPDIVTFEYLRNKPQSPKENVFDLKIKEWENLKTDQGAHFDKEVNIDASTIEPMVTWGTSPQDVVSITGIVPDPEKEKNEEKKEAMNRSLNYMGLKPNVKLTDIKIDKVFIGSCTNGRISDLREVAKIAKGRKVAPNVNALIVPGSGLVKEQAEGEGLDKILKEAGFEWREPGCSMCLAMKDRKSVV